MNRRTAALLLGLFLTGTARALDLALPTDNIALRRGDKEAFYQPTVEGSIDLLHQSAHQIISLIIIGHVRRSIFSKQFRMNTHGEDGVPLPGGFSDVRQ